MAELKYKIEAELENIDKVFKVMPSHDKLPTLPILEIAGVATLLHHFLTKNPSCMTGFQ